MKPLQIKTLAVFLAISVLVLLFDSVGFLDPAKSAAQLVFLPIESAAHSGAIGLADTFSFFTFWRSGEARIKYLEQRNLELLARANRASALEAENAALRQELGVKALAARRLLPAKILGLNRYLSLDVGSTDGAANNMPVVFLDNYLGRIVKVTPRNSFVEMPTDAKAKIPVKVGVVGIVRGLISGQFNSSITLDHVSQNEEIKVGDQVTTEDNLLIGTIQTINSQDSDLFKKASVKPAVDIRRLTTIFVVLQ